MARQKSNKETKSINFDKIVLQALEIRCKKENIPISQFINDVMKRLVINEFEYYRELTKKAAGELHKYQTMMNTAPDKPKKS